MQRFRTDPRVRQTLNQISENIESANQRTQTSLFACSENIIRPCLDALQPCFLSFQTCLEASCQPCCSARDDIRRHRQPRYSRRGRERAVFDFYDDWDREEEEWGNDELDRLLAGDDTQQPGRHAGMEYGYGTRGGLRRNIGAKDGLADDPTLMPQSSVFGFLERLPWKIGGRGTRYRPNPANLQSNIGKKGQEIEQPLMSDSEDGARPSKGRLRSMTAGSRETETSLSSRGDIFPSDDEDDAHEIDDEFAVALGRRTTGATSDENSSKRKHGNSRSSTKTASSRDTRGPGSAQRGTSASSERQPILSSPAEEDGPSLAALKQEEEEARLAEENTVQQRRMAAQRLASERGLSNPSSPIEYSSKEASIVDTSEVTSPAQGDDRPPEHTTGSDGPDNERPQNPDDDDSPRKLA